MIKLITKHCCGCLSITIHVLNVCQYELCVKNENLRNIQKSTDVSYVLWNLTFISSKFFWFTNYSCLHYMGVVFDRHIVIYLFYYGIAIVPFMISTQLILFHRNKGEGCEGHEDLWFSYHYLPAAIVPFFFPYCFMFMIQYKCGCPNLNWQSKWRVFKMISNCIFVTSFVCCIFLTILY